MIKILTQNGIENTNIDGARDHHFNAGNRSGIVKGVLNEGRLFSAADNSIDLDTCELRIFGHRIVIDAVEHKTLTSLPENPTEYSLVASVTRANQNAVSFELLIQSSSASLLQDNISNGNGTYQMKIGNFVQNPNGSISNIVRTALIFCGAESTEVDEELSLVSENPVQNKVVTANLNNRVNKTTTIAGLNLSQNRTAGELREALGVEEGAEANTVDSVNNKTGAVVLDADDISDANTSNKFVSTAEKVTWNGKQGALSNDQLAAVNSGIDSTKVAKIGTNENDITVIKSKIPVSASSENKLVDTDGMQTYALPLSTKYGASVVMSIDSSTYVVTVTLKDQDGNTLGTAQTIDLPLESVVVNGSYNDVTKNVILTLQNGSTIEFSIADLIDGLVPNSRTIAGNALSSDISAQTLTDSLILCNDTTDVDYIMGD